MYVHSFLFCSNPHNQDYFKPVFLNPKYYFLDSKTLYFLLAHNKSYSLSGAKTCRNESKPRSRKSKTNVSSQTQNSRTMTWLTRLKSRKHPILSLSQSLCKKSKRDTQPT